MLMRRSASHGRVLHCQPVQKVHAAPALRWKDAKDKTCFAQTAPYAGYPIDPHHTNVDREDGAPLAAAQFIRKSPSRMYGFWMSEQAGSA